MINYKTNLKVSYYVADNILSKFLLKMGVNMLHSVSNTDCGFKS